MGRKQVSTDYVRIPRDVFRKILGLGRLVEDISEEELVAMRIGHMAVGLVVTPDVLPGDGKGNVSVKWEY